MGNTNSSVRDAVPAHRASDTARVGVEAQARPIHPHTHVHRQVQGGRQHHYIPGGGGRLGIGSSESMGHSPPESPSSATRSPLLFAPQIPTVPIPKAGEFVMGSYYSEGLYGDQGDEEQKRFQQGVPTMIVWTHEGDSVSVQGSWDNWTAAHALQKSGKDFTLVKVLPSGVYQYKFIVDGEWRYAADHPAVFDEMGNVNNVLDVQDYVPENLESLAGFDPPRSPESSYTDPFPGPEDFTKEPPLVPDQLHLTLLNVPPMVEVPGALPRPQHVILNHLYVEKGKSSRSVLSLGATHRFRTKYVTVVLYKPLRK